MVYQYLQQGQALAQRLANTPAGQRAAELAQRGMDAVSRLENKWPSLPRGVGGQFPSRQAVDKIPLQPFSRGIAGATGVGMGGGQFDGVSSRFASQPQSTVPQALWDQLTVRGGGVPQSPVQQPAAVTPETTVMDSIMANRALPTGSFGLQGPNMPAAVYGSPTPEYSGAPGYEGAAGALVPTAASVRGQTPPMPMPRPKDLPGRTPGFLDQILSGPDYQSNNMPVNVQAAGPAMQGQQMPDIGINWGDPNSAADFFRADQMLRQNPNLPGFLGGY